MTSPTTDTAQRKKALRRLALLTTCAHFYAFTSMDAYVALERNIAYWCRNPPSWWYDRFRRHDAPSEATVGNILRQWTDEGLLSRTRSPRGAYVYYWNEEEPWISGK